MNAETLIVWALVTLVGSFVGSYLGGYLKRKGENLATHEDLDKLVAQVSAVTQTTKDIEAKISTEVWDRQRRWELKRDILFETARKAGRLKETITMMYAVYHTQKQYQEKGLTSFPLEKIVEVGTASVNAAGEFDGMVMLVNATCGLELAKAVLEFSVLSRTLSNYLVKEQFDAYTPVAKDLVTKSNTLAAAIRKELEIPVTK